MPAIRLSVTADVSDSHTMACISRGPSTMDSWREAAAGDSTEETGNETHETPVILVRA